MYADLHPLKHWPAALGELSVQWRIGAELVGCALDLAVEGLGSDIVLSQQKHFSQSSTRNCPCFRCYQSRKIFMTKSKGSSGKALLRKSESESWRAWRLLLGFRVVIWEPCNYFSTRSDRDLKFAIADKFI